MRRRGGDGLLPVGSDVGDSCQAHDLKRAPDHTLGLELDDELASARLQPGPGFEERVGYRRVEELGLGQIDDDPAAGPAASLRKLAVRGGEGSLVLALQEAGSQMREN